MAPTAPSTRRSLARLADAVRPSRDDFVDALVALTASEVGELNHDDALRDLLHASIAENVDRLIDSVLVSTFDASADSAPAGALDYARRLGHSPATLASLLRAYRIGQARFTEHCLGAADRVRPKVPAADQIVMVSAIAAYLDWVCEQVTVAYQVEHERWLGGQEGSRRQWVNRIIDGEPVDVAEAERALGYRLSGAHVAADVWLDTTRGARTEAETAGSAVLAAAAQSIAAALGTGAGAIRVTARLVVPANDRLIHCWFSLDSEPAAAEVQRRMSILPSRLGEGLRVSLGSVGLGRAGFRRSHEQAARARGLVGGAREPRVVSWPEVAPAALLLTNPEEASELMTDVLGPLAGPGRRLAELRETLLVHLAHHGSLALTAAELHVHRNTVGYRIQQVERLRPGLLERDTFAVLAALTARRWLPDA